MITATNRKKVDNLIEYILIIALFYVTGGAFSYTGYSIQITLFFCVAAFILFVKGKVDNLKKSVLILCLQAIFLFLVPLLHNDSFSTYIAIAMQLCIGAFCAAIIPFQNFKDKFIKVITIYATISLVCFVISMFYPEVAYLFPKTIGDASVDYYNAYIYVFMQSNTTHEIMVRNPGICWEPGCYQMFLNFGLILLLESINRKPTKFQIFSFIVLVVSVLTTMSSLGVILLIFVLVCYHKMWLGKILSIRTLIVFCCSFFLAFIFLREINFGKFIVDKIEREFSSSGSGVLDRISLDRIQYLFADNTFYFFGMSFDKWLSFDLSLWNSIIHSFLCLGVPFTIIHLISYWKGARIISSSNGICLFALMILCCFTETLFWRVFFNTIAYYGFVAKQDR